MEIKLCMLLVILVSLWYVDSSFYKWRCQAMVYGIQILTQDKMGGGGELETIYSEEPAVNGYVTVFD